MVSRSTDLDQPSLSRDGWFCWRMSLPGGEFTSEQVTRIIVVTCEPPEKSDRPITHWTSRKLADEVTKRGIVESIAPARVGRSLREAVHAAPQEPLLAEHHGEGSGGKFQDQVETVRVVLKPLTRPTEKSSRNSHNRA